MILAYRWARKKYQQRQQERDGEPSQPPPTNTIEVPIQPHSESAARDSATRETSRKLESPFNAAGNEASTAAQKDATAGAKTEKPEPTPEEKAEQRRKRSYRWKIVIGLFAPFTLQSLDTTIIASALPFIASDFSKRIQQPILVSLPCPVP